MRYLSINQNNILSFLLLFLMIFYSCLNSTSAFKNDDKKEHTKRNQLNETVNFILKNKLLFKKDLEILNFNYNLSIWLILNGYNNFSFIPVSFWTPKTDEMLEEDLISSIKFLGLNKSFFYNLIKNKKSTWRFKNNFVYNYFGRKYMANSLIVFNNNKLDFEKDEINFIQSNNLLISHQIIMPKSEINRLLNKFDNINSKINPDIFIIDKSNIIITDKFDNKNYCIIFENKQFSIFSNKKLNYKCLLSKN